MPAPICLGLCHLKNDEFQNIRSQIGSGIGVPSGPVLKVYSNLNNATVNVSVSYHEYNNSTMPLSMMNHIPRSWTRLVQKGLPVNSKSTLLRQ